MPGSEIRVDTISGSDSVQDKPVVFPLGVVVSAGYALTSPGMNVTGICTASNFKGNGSAITNLPGLNVSKTLALGLLL
jgi:hypothetical protein